MEIEFSYDVVCPYAYLASCRVEALAARLGARLTWKPVLLGGILRAVGSPDVPADTWASAKVRMGALDLYRQAALWDVPFAVNPVHPARSVDAMRLILVADEALRPVLSHALFEAYHVDGVDISDRAALQVLADRFGLDLARIDAPAIKEELRARTEEAVSRGMFGVPGFWARTEDQATGRLWWGADRMHLVEAALGGEPLAPPLHRASSGRAVLELFHDFSSPFSYLGATQAERLAREAGAELVWRPMLLGALFKAIGTPNVPLQAMNAARARYQLQDLHDWAAWWGVPFAFPRHFPVRSVTALRVSIAQPRLIPSLYEALWVQDRDIGDPQVLGRVIEDAGFSAEALLAQAERPEIKATLRANTDQAVDIGACGAPTWRVLGQDAGGTELPEVVIWGQDRLDLVRACLGGWRPPMG